MMRRSSRILAEGSPGMLKRRLETMRQLCRIIRAARLSALDALRREVGVRRARTRIHGVGRE